jgi:hypothetical protein
MRFGGLDVGYNLINLPTGTLGAYAGYRALYESGKGFGCVQIATNAPICGTPIEPNNLLGLTETETWRAAAIGFNARLPFADRWRFELDAAYLPFVDMQGIDQHWNRPDINPGPERGYGWGTQVEAILSYMLTDRWSVGLGGRYQYLATTSTYTQFPASFPNQVEKFYTERYGGFLQASYRFGGATNASPGPLYRAQAMPANWTGLYIGGRFGAAAGQSDWSDPFGTPVYGDHVAMGGALGGGQIGYNYQAGRIVYGVEAPAPGDGSRERSPALRAYRTRQWPASIAARPSTGSAPSRAGSGMRPTRPCSTPTSVPPGGARHSISISPDSWASRRLRRPRSTSWVWRSAADSNMP